MPIQEMRGGNPPPGDVTPGNISPWKLAPPLVGQGQESVRVSANCQILSRGNNLSGNMPGKLSDRIV